MAKIARHYGQNEVYAITIIVIETPVTLTLRPKSQSRILFVKPCQQFKTASSPQRLRHVIQHTIEEHHEGKKENFDGVQGGSWSKICNFAPWSTCFEKQRTTRYME